jgi:hypothetical protein
LGDSHRVLRLCEDSYNRICGKVQEKNAVESGYFLHCGMCCKNNAVANKGVDFRGGSLFVPAVARDNLVINLCNS